MKSKKKKIQVFGIDMILVHSFWFKVKIFTWNTGHFYAKKPTNDDLSVCIPENKNAKMVQRSCLVASGEQKFILDSLCLYCLKSHLGWDIFCLKNFV